MQESGTTRIVACLLALSGCVSEVRATGLNYDAETEVWKEDVSQLLELQAKAWGDPEWPAFVTAQTDITLKLHDGPFKCGTVLAEGCTGNMGPMSGKDGSLIWFMSIDLMRHASVKDTALPYELGHVYAQTHGIPDDDTYHGVFWDQARTAIDQWLVSGK